MRLLVRRAAPVLAGLCLALPAPSRTQLPDLGGKAREIADRLPGLDDAVARLLDAGPAISTSMDDAVTEAPFLDGWDPAEDAQALARLARGDDGAWPLVGGDWVYEAQSYCLHAGTHASSGGAGYLYAPLRGDRAPIVRAVLDASLAHPEIEQRTIQLLIWSILARTKVDDLAPRIRAAARTLLTSRQIYALNGGALGLVPDRALREAMDELPEPARAVMRAEARLREILTDAAATYEEAERAALLPGAPPPPPDRRVPAERWSYHPDGYFVRFDPSGYSRTRWEISVPVAAVVTRDARGRVARVDGPRGRRLELAYADTASLTGPAGWGGVDPVPARRYATVRLVVLTREREDDPARTAEWSGLAAAAGAGGRALDALDRLLEAASGPGAARGAAEARLRADFRDLSALLAALGVGSDPDRAVAADVAERARMWTACRLLGGCAEILVPPRPGRSRGPTPDGAAPGGAIGGPRSGRAPAVAGLSPSGTVAVPANPSSQRLAQSGRPAPDGPGPEGPDENPNRSDPNAGPETDWDQDGIPNHRDDDADGDGVPDIVDPDRDNDGIPNRMDIDWDNDGIPNVTDDDADGDGLPGMADPDRDGDTIPNDSDWDLDEDGTPNISDMDVDGDAVPNVADDDIDGDGIPNIADPDVDGDGLPNAGDPDTDGDGVPDPVDPDENGDGIVEPRDPTTGLKL